MKVLLVRPNYINFFASTDVISTEPLELEYIYTQLKDADFECKIYDGQVEKAKFDTMLVDFHPDIVAITGYINMQNKMINLSERVKEYSPQIIVVIGGVHAEINFENFYKESIDFIIHSGGTRPLLKLLESFNENRAFEEIKGICYKDEKNNWIKNMKAEFNPSELPIPDRSHFYKYQHHFKYLEYAPCAIVKTAYGCCFSCDFCYCRVLNDGKYCERSLNNVLDEISDISCDNIWVVDDTFLISYSRIEKFAELVKEKNINKNFIIYGRADFIASSEKHVEMLSNAGVKMILVGFESAEDNILQQYSKQTNLHKNTECIKTLKKYNIDCVGLFIVDPDFTIKGFKTLEKWILSSGLKYFSLSILTPIPGTPLYNKYANRVDGKLFDDWDFLHVVFKPEYLSKKRFYLQFYILFLKLIFVHFKFQIFERKRKDYIFRIIRDFMKKLFLKIFIIK